MEKDFNFEFGNNRKLKKLYDSWKTSNDYRGFVIVGPSACGKTHLLDKIRFELPKTSYIKGSQLVEQIHRDILNGGLYNFVESAHEILLIDDLDLLIGKTATTNTVCDLIQRREYNSKGKKRLIICTFVDEEMAYRVSNILNFELIFMNHTKPSLRIVKDKIKEFNLKLCEEEVRKLANLGSIFELNCELKKISFDNNMSNNSSEEYKIILTSRGLNTETGTRLVKTVFENEKIQYGSIFLMTLPEYEVDEIVKKNCMELGFTNIYLAKDYEGKAIPEMPHVDTIFVTEGQTFEVAAYLKRNNYDEYIRGIIEDGGTYIGASAGAILAASSFKETEKFESNYLRTSDYSALGILPRNGCKSDIIIPHHTEEQLKQYISTMTEDEIASYRRIYNVANDETLVMDCVKIGDTVKMLRKKVYTDKE